MGLSLHGPGLLPLTVLVLLDQQKVLHALSCWLVRHPMMKDLNASATHAPLCIENVAQVEEPALPQDHAVSLINCTTACGLCDSSCEEQALLQTHANCLSTSTQDTWRLLLSASPSEGHAASFTSFALEQHDAGC